MLNIDNSIDWSTGINYAKVLIVDKHPDPNALGYTYRHYDLKDAAKCEWDMIVLYWQKFFSDDIHVIVTYYDATGKECLARMF